uniref:Uncharacterized protein n=1 Tax=Plectus sambesii TaxID=2011161 RepID=A0A914VTR1_9BILA
RIKRRVDVSPEPPSVITAPPSYAPPPPPIHQHQPLLPSLPRQSPTIVRKDLYTPSQPYNVPIQTQPMSAVERMEREPGVQKLILVK